MHFVTFFWQVQNEKTLWVKHYYYLLTWFCWFQLCVSLCVWQIPGLWAFIWFRRATTQKTTKSTCSSKRMLWMENMLGRPHMLALDSSAKYANTLTHSHTSWLPQRKKIQTHTKGEKQRHPRSHTDIMWNSFCIWKNTWRVSEWLS